MLGLLIAAIVIGGIVAGVTGIGFLFWIVSIFIFICGLPFALVDGYIQSKIDYVQDREDYRTIMRDIAEDERMDRYLSKLDELDNYDEDEPSIYIDNRQIHYHTYQEKKAKRKNTTKRLS